MAALPYIQLYVADYIADTMHLTTEEHGAYLLLIMNYWQTGKPLQSERIPNVVRLTKNRFNEIEKTLSEFFTIIEPGLWVHERIEMDLAFVRSRSEKASESAKKRWMKKPSEQAITDQKSNHAKVMRTLSHTNTDLNTEIKIDSNSKKSHEVVLDSAIDPEIWKQWIQYRQERKLICNPMTMQAQVKLLAKIAANGFNPNETILSSITNGWQGLFEPKKQSNANIQEQSFLNNIHIPDGMTIYEVLGEILDQDIADIGLTGGIDE